MSKIKYKILEAIGPTQSGGTEKHLITLLEGIDKDKFLVEVACFSEGPFVEQLRELGIQTTVFPRNQRYFLSNLLNFMKFLRLKRFELLHAHTARLALLVAALERVPVKIETKHGMGIKHFGNQFIENLYGRVKSSFSEIIIAPDDMTKKLLISKIKIDEKKIVTIPNGINLSKFEKKSNSQEKKRSLGIGKDTVIIGTVGRLTRVKGLKYLIEAASEVIDEYPSTKFIIVGDGDLREDLLKLVINMGLEARFKFLGYRDDIEELIQIFDLAVFPSLREGLSLAILEVMACGKPVVATDVGGNRQLLGEGNCGLIVPVAQTGPLTEAILLLLRDKKLAKEMGQRAQRLVYEKYNSKVMVNRIERLYEKLLLKKM